MFKKHTEHRDLFMAQRTKKTLYILAIILMITLHIIYYQWLQSCPEPNQLNILPSQSIAFFERVMICLEQ